MTRLNKKDLWFSVITGGYTGVIIWLVADFLRVRPPLGIPLVSLIVILPIVWLCGISLGYFFGSWLKFFNQFGKFVAVGFTNFAVDLGVLNLLIAGTGINKGIWYTAFATISFLVATGHSYFWNRSWVFRGSSAGSSGEFAKFFTVTVAAAVVNAGTASVIVNLFGPHFGLSGNGWANIGKIAGSAVALLVSFAGFRMAVFKKTS